MKDLWVRQIAGVLRLELKRTAFSRRGWWIYCLAIGPVLISLLHWLIETHRRSGRHSLGDDSVAFAGIGPRPASP